MRGAVFTDARKETDTCRLRAGKRKGYGQVIMLVCIPIFMFMKGNYKMGVFSEMDIDRRQAEECGDATDTTASAIRAKVEELDDARQEAEAVAAKATLERLKREGTSDQKEGTSDNSSADTPVDREAERRRAHEAAEAVRKAEWEAKRRQREEEELFAWENAVALDDDALATAAQKRVGEEAERLTRRNIKQCIAEVIQTYCLGDLNFARQVMHPRKSMAHCYRYVIRKAKEFILQEMKDQGIEPSREGYGSDIPDGVCYQWAIDYFNDMNVPEDKVEEEEFVPRPYMGSGVSRPKKKPEKIKAEPKKPEPKAETPKSTVNARQGQLDMFSGLNGGDVA